MSHALAPLLSLVAAAAAATASPAPPPDAPAPGSAPLPIAAAAAPAPAAPPRAVVLEEVSGEVKAVDRRAHRITVEAASGPVTLSLDRNTMVYTPAGLGTVLDVVPGALVRAGRNADLLAYWVQVRAAGAAKVDPQPTPGQGSAPGGGASAPSTEPRGGVGPGPVAPPGAAPGTPGPRSGP